MVDIPLKKLRCAVIGLGRIGWQFHIPQIVKHSDRFTLLAVVDPDETRLQEAQKQFGAKICCKSYQELPLDEIDLIIIASPTRFHCEQACYFLENGKDVFCDKPVAVSLEQARQMGDTAQNHGRKLMVYQPHRLTHECLTAQTIIASGKLGRIFKISRNSEGFVHRNDWQALYANGGGMLFNYGAHYIDQMLYLTHDSCEKAKCELRSVLTLGDADDVVQAVISGKSGILYDLTINMGTALPLPGIIIYGTNGTAMEATDTMSWKIRYCKDMPHVEMQTTMAAANRMYPSEDISWIEETIPTLEERYDDFYPKAYDYFAENASPFVPFEETLEVMRTIDLCMKNAH